MNNFSRAHGFGATPNSFAFPDSLRTPLPIARAEARNRVVLAPMSGVSDLPFRQLAYRYGAGLVVSEMVASQELVVDNPDSRLRMDVSGLPTSVVQLAGRQAQWMAEAAKIAEGAGASIIDINMGCPAKKVTSGYSGSALMRDLDHALTLIDATVGAVDVPVTLKMRLGWDDTTLNAPELARRAEDAGIQMLTVHGRTRCQFYKGRANWDAIARVKERVSIPVIANGDLISLHDLAAMGSASGADGFMTGRGAYGRPWLPGYLAAPDPTEFLQRLPEPADLILEHHASMVAHYGTYKDRPLGLRNARKHLGWYLETTELAHAPTEVDRATLMRSDDCNAVTAAIKTVWADSRWRIPQGRETAAPAHDLVAEAA
ncbi:MAG: tRNA dihydrouridine synthase DusB [Pseudomonadota bacterium]